MERIPRIAFFRERGEIGIFLFDEWYLLLGVVGSGVEKKNILCIADACLEGGGFKCLAAGFRTRRRVPRSP